MAKDERLARWSDICRGHRCDRKDNCRRHTFYLVMLAKEKELNRNPFLRRCGSNSNFAAQIPLDNTMWASTPLWWEKQ